MYLPRERARVWRASYLAGEDGARERLLKHGSLGIYLLIQKRLARVWCESLSLKPLWTVPGYHQALESATPDDATAGKVGERSRRLRHAERWPAQIGRSVGVSPRPLPLWLLQVDVEGAVLSKCRHIGLMRPGRVRFRTC